MSNKQKYQNNQSKPAVTTETTTVDAVSGTIEETNLTDVLEGNESSAGIDSVVETLNETEEPTVDKPEVSKDRGFNKTMATMDEQISPLDRSSTDSTVFKMASSTLEDLASRLDIPFLPDFKNKEITGAYRAIYKEIVRCLNVEKTSDLTALCNFISNMIVEYDRTFSPSRIFTPLQHMVMSPKELRFYEEIFNIFIMLNTNGTIDRGSLEAKLNGLLDGDKSERFIKWVMIKQN